MSIQLHASAPLLKGKEPSVSTEWVGVEEEEEEEDHFLPLHQVALPRP